MNAGHDSSRKKQKELGGVDGRGDLISIGSMSGGIKQNAG